MKLSNHIHRSLTAGVCPNILYHLCFDQIESRKENSNKVFQVNDASNEGTPKEQQTHSSYFFFPIKNTYNITETSTLTTDLQD